MLSLTYIYSVKWKTIVSKNSLNFTKYRYRDYIAMPLLGIGGPSFHDKLHFCKSQRTRGHEAGLLNSGSKI